MRLLGKSLICALVTTCALAVIHAQDPAAKTATAPAPTFKQVFLFQLKDTEDKLVGLAQATPEEKFAWRPAPGVRSTGEVFVHEATGNAFFLMSMGVKPAGGLTMQSEKEITGKDKIIATMKTSFAQVRDTVNEMQDADLVNKTGKLMGRTLTYEDLLFVLANHMHEHLGQSIAYARMNGIVPPWSAKGEN